MAKQLTLQTIFSAVDRLSGPVKKMSGNVGVFSASMARGSKLAGAAFGGIGTAIKATAAIGAAAVGAGVLVGKFANDFAERGDDIARNAGILGLTAEGYQELSYAAMMADVETESFAAASKKLNVNLGQLKTKTGALYSTLSKSNPQLAKQLRSAKDTDAAFSLVADAIAKETNVQKRATIAVAAFGKSGQELIPMMQSLTAARKEARTSGSIISNEDVERASTLDDAMKRLNASVNGPVNHALARVAENMATVADKASAWMRANEGLINSGIDQFFVSFQESLPSIIEGMKVFVEMMKSMKKESDAFWTGLKKFDKAIQPAGRVMEAVQSPKAWKYGLEKVTGSMFGNNKLPAISLSADPEKSIGQMVDEARAKGKAAQAPSALGGMKKEGTPFPSAPISPSQAIAQTSTSVSRSELAVSFANPPPGMNSKQTGNAPGITVNMGRTMASAGGAH